MKDLLPKQMFIEIFKVDSGSIYKSESHRLVARTKTSPNITMLSSQIPTWQLGLCSGWGDDLKFNRCLETISEDAELSLSTDAWQRIKICFVFFIFVSNLVVFFPSPEANCPKCRNAENAKLKDCSEASGEDSPVSLDAADALLMLGCNASKSL